MKHTDRRQIQTIFALSSKKARPPNHPRLAASAKIVTAMPDHIHLYVSIPPKYSVSEFVGYLKGKSSLMIFDRHANLKYKYGNRHFWCRGYYVDTVGRNEKTIREYVRNQLQEDIASDQICMKEFTDPFTGEPVTKGKLLAAPGRGQPVITLRLANRSCVLRRSCIRPL